MKIPAPGDSRVRWFVAPDGPTLVDQLDAARSESSDSVPVARPPSGGPARLAIVDPDERKYALARKLVTKGKPWRGRSDIFFSPEGLALTGGRVVFVFPGVEPSFGADQTDLPTLASVLGLAAPDVDQSTLGRQSAAIIRLGIFMDVVLRKLGVTPDLVAGHSLGEWVATISAGSAEGKAVDEFIAAINLDDNLDELEGLPDVEFIALGCGADVARSVLSDFADMVVSHDNCPRQSIICVPTSQVETALEKLRANNVLGYALNLKSGFHTPALSPILPWIRNHVDKIPLTEGTIPLWSATLAAPYPTDPEALRELHLRHLVEPLRFRELIENLYDEGARIFVQPGIGSPVGFVDDTLGDTDHLAIAALNPKRSALGQIRRTLAALWVEGVEVDTRPIDAPYEADEPDDAVRFVAPSPKSVAAMVAAVPPTSATKPVSTPASAPAPAQVIAPAASVASSPALRPTAPAPPSRVSPAAAVAPSPTTAPSSAAQSVRSRSDRHPVLAAATMVLNNAAQSTQEVLAAWQSSSPRVVTRTHRPAPVRHQPVARAASPGAIQPAPALEIASTPAAPTAPVPSAARMPEPAPITAASDTGKRVDIKHLSLDTFPEIWDHCLMLQPDGWPDRSDWFPVVAFTQQLPFYAETAESRLPGRTTVSMSDVRVMRWLDIGDPVDLPIESTVTAPDEVRVSFLPFGRATVQLGDEFPVALPVNKLPLRNPRPTTVDAKRLFTERHMFHGPRFQGVRKLGPYGDDGIVGELEGMADPGALIDNVGKFIAYWVMEHRQNFGESGFPIGIDRIEWYGPEPQPGEVVGIDARIVELQDDRVKADCDLTYADGSLFCHIDGWGAYIFHADERVFPSMRFPDRNLVSETQPGGWLMCRERWPSGAARELFVRRYLSRAERDEYAKQNLRAQRSWLLARIAAKDAVRQWLADRGKLAFPVEIAVADTDDGGLVVSSSLIDGHDLRVAVADVEWVAVAVLAEGIDPAIEIFEVDETPTSYEADHDNWIALDPEDITSATGKPLVVAWTGTADRPDLSASPSGSR